MAGVGLPEDGWAARFEKVDSPHAMAHVAQYGFFDPTGMLVAVGDSLEGARVAAALVYEQLETCEECGQQDQVWNMIERCLSCGVPL